MCKPANGLMAYDWPGNVRQLENVMERAFALSPGRSQLMAEDLPPDLRKPSAVPSVMPEIAQGTTLEFDRRVREFELALIARALDQSGGNKRVAADLLGIKRTTLIEKLKRLERD